MVDCSASESFAQGPETTTLIEDWVTIWQSEMAGLVLDRELQEGLLRSVDHWAAQAGAILAMVRAVDAGAPGTASPPGPAPAAAASDDPGIASERDASVAELHRRIAELELRLASLEPPDC